MVKHKQVQKNKGFTLVEVLVMLGVITILSSMVYLGYNAYAKNVKQVQITTVAHASLKTLKAYALEKRKFPSTEFCLPSGGFCCRPTGSLASPMYCNRLSETAIQKYTPNNPTFLPVFTGMQLCTSGTMSDTAPCTTNGTNGVGAFYTAAVKPTEAGLYASNDSSIEGFLVYYIGADYICGVKPLFEVVSSTVGAYTPDEPLYTLGPANSTATYSSQNTDPDTGVVYNECIIGVST